MSTTAAAAGIRRHTGTYPAEPGQVRIARDALGGWLEGWPRADEAVLIASEFARMPAERGAMGRTTMADRTGSMS